MSRSALYFKRLADASTKLQGLKQLYVAEEERMNGLITHKAELTRIYEFIERVARGGGIRAFVPQNDPVWKNEFVLEELHRQGFAISKNYHFSQGAIEWWHAEEKKEDKKLA